MKRSILLFLGILFVNGVFAQHDVQFIVNAKTAIKNNKIFIAGSFNYWDSSAKEKYRLKKIGPDTYSISLSLVPGTYTYKYHRGDWSSVEKRFDGEEIDNRTVNISGKAIFTDEVEAWRDQIISDKWASIATSSHDSVKVRAYYGLANIYSHFPEWYNIDSGLFYIKKSLLLLEEMKENSDLNEEEKKGYVKSLIYMQSLSADLLHTLGNFSKELELRLDNIQLARNLKDENFGMYEYFGIASAYGAMKDYNNMLNYSRKLYDYISSRKDDPSYVYFNYQGLKLISLAHFNLNHLDSTLLFANQLYSAPSNNFITRYFINAYAYQLKGDTYYKMGKDSLALQNYKSSLSIAYPSYAFEAGIRSKHGIAKIFHKWGRNDSALYYGVQSLNDINQAQSDLQALRVNHNSMIAEFGPLVAMLYSVNKKHDSAYYYLQLTNNIKDSLYNLEKIRQFQNLGFNETLRLQQLEQQGLIANQQFRSRIKIVTLIAGVSILSVLAIILYRNNRQKQKAAEKIERAYTRLRETQNQLIQSEKMASLGELTAGIAHEIQNPLNFINNFSEVNTELLNELRSEIDKGNYEEAKALAADLISNEQKISHHGKRADGIVKGMLQHSRANTGVKEETDINTLADEYLRLAFHGLRAKDKSFNATFNTHFDESIDKVNVVPQDIGRVLLNLITNAFYAVNEKKKQDSNGYAPTVSVTTKKLNGEILISVKDNGNGIPPQVIDKIFQPFFSTKPTGQGTGLGLSMSYDIIKAHGGELMVDSKEGEGTTFYFQLKQN